MQEISREEEITVAYPWAKNPLILQALQPSNRCSVHTDLSQCGDPLAEDYRLDSETGECMKEGWVFFGGDYHIAQEERAERICQTLWGAGLDQVYDDESDDLYYTEWD